MDMRSNFKFTIEGQTFEVMCESWQEALAFFLQSANNAGFTVDEKREKAINEIARSGRISL